MKIAYINTLSVDETDARNGGMTLTGKTEVLGEKLVPVPLCPPQIPHGLTWNRTRASAVRGLRQTA